MPRSVTRNRAAANLVDHHMAACRHPLCEIVGDGDCSLASGVSRGYHTQPRVAAPHAELDWNDAS
jgi:hypothetical protein